MENKGRSFPYPLLSHAHEMHFHCRRAHPSLPSFSLPPRAGAQYDRNNSLVLIAPFIPPLVPT